jgi:hypothetical protein
MVTTITNRRFFSPFTYPSVLLCFKIRKYLWDPTIELTSTKYHSTNFSFAFLLCRVYFFYLQFKNTESQPQDQPTRFFVFSIPLALVTFFNMEYALTRILRFFRSPLLPEVPRVPELPDFHYSRISVFPRFRPNVSFFPRINHCVRSSVGVKAGVSVGCVPFPAPGQKQKSGIEIIYHLIEKTCQWKLAGATWQPPHLAVAVSPLRTSRPSLPRSAQAPPHRPPYRDSLLCTMTTAWSRIANSRTGGAPSARTKWPHLPALLPRQPQ